MFFPKVISPVYETIVSNNNILTIIEVLVGGEDYKLCEQSSNNMSVNHKKGEWGLGLSNYENDPRIVERVGRLGEMAFAKIFGLGVDLDYREFGDNYDFIFLNNLTVDIKTAICRPLYDAGLIRAASSENNLLPLKCAVYFFSYIKNENRNEKRATIHLLGGKKRNDIINMEIKKARKGHHYNYEILYKDLIPVKKIFEVHKSFALRNINSP